MFIRLETASGVSITRQIVDQVTGQIAAGTLSSGDRLPSVRELARQLAINQNTVLRVYERLTDQGLIERIHGSGTYVASRARQRARKPVNLLREDAARIAYKAVNLGARKADLQNLISHSYTKAKQQHAAAKRRGA